MKRNKVKYTLFILVFFVLFSACGIQQINLPTNIIDTTIPTETGENIPSAIPSSTSIPTEFISKEDECIGTFEDFAYSYEDVEDYSRPDDILPLPPWEVELEFPVDGAVYSIAGIREIESKTQIWNYRIDFGNSTPKDAVYEFIIYDLDTKEQTVISAEIEETDVWVDRLYIAEDGTIWGRNMWFPYGDYSLNSIPILSKYNPEIQRFEFDENAFIVPLIDNDLNFRDWVDIFLDEASVFWFFVPYDGIYSYSPSNEDISKHIDIPDYKVRQPMMAPDGNFYYKLYLDFGYDWSGEIEIYQFSPTTGEEIIYTKIPKSWPKSGDMLMDNTGRFWFGTIGWLNPDGTWYLMHPDLQTHFEKVRGSRGMGFLWEIPVVQMESSNGYIWFQKYREIDFGVAWYNPKTGESCWFTNNNSGLMEGPGQIMWLATDHKLFKYVLNP